MENQHRKITGYRELSQEEIDRMNLIKDAAKQIGRLVAAMEKDIDADQRWIAIGKTNLQQGFMALTRGLTKPESF